MTRAASVWIAVVAVAVALVAVLEGYHYSFALRELHTATITVELHPIASLLRENQTLLQALQSEPFGENEAGILESYLIKIRRDGVARHADMKQRLDTLADNNTSIVALIKVYGPHAKTTAFVAEADRFRNYASAWRDRWNSIMEIFMAGGNYPAAGVPFPSGFAAAVDAEMAAAK